MAVNHGPITVAKLKRILTNEEFGKVRTQYKKFKLNLCNVEQLNEYVKETLGQKSFIKLNIGIYSPECFWLINPILISGRAIARWGLSGAVRKNKLILFGGRGTDDISRCNIFCIDLKSHRFRQLKGQNPPGGRDCHTCQIYKDLLIIFGGCTGDTNNYNTFNETYTYNLTTESFKLFEVKNSPPAKRDGHAAWQVDQHMIIFGGSSQSQGTLRDMWSLDCEKHLWTQIEILGTHPGNRESMGFTQIRNRLYVFGGNTALDDRSDEYSNELYEMLFIPGKVQSRKVYPMGKPPRSRMLCSLTAINTKQLVLFGGEGMRGVFLNDVWMYDIKTCRWAQIKPNGPKIQPRSLHLTVAFQNSIVVIGGMNEAKTALGDISYLKFGEPNQLHSAVRKTQESPPATGKKPNKMQKPLTLGKCSQCDHENGFCCYKKASQSPFTRENFYPSASITVSVVNECIQQFDNSVQVICSIALYFGELNSTVEFDYLGSSRYANGVVLRDHSSNLSTDRAICKGVLKTSIDTGISPEMLFKLVNDHEILGPLLYFDNNVLIITSNNQYYTVMLISKSAINIALFTVVFDMAQNEVYPFGSAFNGNWINILERSHIEKSTIFSEKNSTRVFLYSQNFQRTNGIKVEGISLEMTLQHLFFKEKLPESSKLRFMVQGREVEYDYLYRIYRQEGRKAKSELFKVKIFESPMEGLSGSYIYYDNLLVNHIPCSQDPPFLHIYNLTEPSLVTRRCILKWSPDLSAHLSEATKKIKVVEQAGEEESEQVESRNVF